MQAAGGIDDDHIARVLPRMFQRTPRNIDRSRTTLGEDRDADLLPEHLKLVDGGRTMNVRRREQREPSLPLQM